MAPTSFATIDEYLASVPAPVKQDQALVKELLTYRGPKENLSFPLDRPLPSELIRRVAVALAREHGKRSAGLKEVDMAQNKTQATEASVGDYLDAIADPCRRKDCDALVKLMGKVTKQGPKMWGPSIVGFGSYHYRYESGREGDSCLTGFSSRKSDLSVYLVASFPGQHELLARLGKHKMGKACLYVCKLTDIDRKVLQQLVAGSVAEVKRRYG